MLNKRKELIEKHPYSIWKGKEGLWHTYLPDTEKKRIHKRSSTRQGIEDIVADYWKEQMENPTVKDIYEQWITGKLSREEIFILNIIHEKNLTAKGYSNLRTLIYGIFKLAKKKKYIISSQLDLINLGLLLAFKTGVRPGELAALQKEDLLDRSVDVHRTEIHYQNEDGENVFMKNGKRIRTYSFTWRLKSICQKLDIPVRSLNKIRKT